MPEGKKAKNKKNYRLGTKTANEKRGAETAVPFLFFFLYCLFILDRGNSIGKEEDLLVCIDPFFLCL